MRSPGWARSVENWSAIPAGTWMRAPRKAEASSPGIAGALPGLFRGPASGVLLGQQRSDNSPARLVILPILHHARPHSPSVPAQIPISVRAVAMAAAGSCAIEAAATTSAVPNSGMASAPPRRAAANRARCTEASITFCEASCTLCTSRSTPPPAAIAVRAATVSAMRDARFPRCRRKVLALRKVPPAKAASKMPSSTQGRSQAERPMADVRATGPRR